MADDGSGQGTGGKGAGRLHKLTRATETLEALDLYGRIEGLSRIGDIDNPARIDDALRRVRVGIEQSVANPSRLHGRRVESMFEAMVASLGEVKLLKSEDSGDCYSRDEVRMPDFRVVTTEDIRLLVEVKSAAPGAASKGFRLRASDVLALERYAALAGGELRIALFWADLNYWTLVPASAFVPAGNKLRISIQDAMKANEMAVLGDVTVGTTPPLCMTLRAVDQITLEDGAEEVPFTVKSVELECGGRKVEEPVEQRIAVFLMLNGDWEEQETPLVEDGRVAGVRFAFAPIELPPARQGFSMLGTLSSMFSHDYLVRSSSDTGVSEFRLDSSPGALGALIPEGYKGSALRLWRFILQPTDPRKAGESAPMPGSPSRPAADK
jgi:hypothetical protein